MMDILEMDFNHTFEFIQKFNKPTSLSAAVPSFGIINRENEFQDVEKEESNDNKKHQDNISSPESAASKHEEEMKYLCSLLGDCKKDEEKKEVETTFNDSDDISETKFQSLFHQPGNHKAIMERIHELIQHA